MPGRTPVIDVLQKELDAKDQQLKVRNSIYAQLSSSGQIQAEKAVCMRTEDDFV